MRIKIEKSGINGEGIGFLNKKPIFIPSALPGEEVEAEIIKEADSFTTAELVKVYTQSTNRILPRCEFQAECGGCALMIATQAYQRELKDRNLKQSLLKYMGKTDFRRINPVVANPKAYQYRNQCKYPIQLVKGNLTAGFYKSGTNHFIPISTCILHDPDLEEVKTQILDILNKAGFPDFDSPRSQGLRTLVLRAFEGKVQATLITGDIRFEPRRIEELLKIEKLTSLYQSINTDRHAHDPFGSVLIHLGKAKTLDFTFSKLSFKLTPKAFFQLNATQAETLFKTVVSKVKAGGHIVDVYCGVGAMTLLLAKQAKSVVGIEVLKEAVESAQENAKLNGVENVRFLAGDASKRLESLMSEMVFDTLVVDPPRAGLDQAMVQAILKTDIPQLIYVSCNPSTLAKNLKELSVKYDIKSMTPFDLFTHTPLLETVVELRLKKAQDNNP